MGLFPVLFLCSFSLDFEFLTYINLQSFYVRMFILLPVANFKQKENVMPVPLPLWASQAFTPVELSKLTQLFRTSLPVKVAYPNAELSSFVIFSGIIKSPEN